MARVCFEAAVRLGFKFTEEAELYNGGMKFRKGGGFGDSVPLFSGFVYMYVCQQGAELDAELFTGL